MNIKSDPVRMPDGTEYCSVLVPDPDYGNNPPDDEGAWPTLSTYFVYGPGEWRAERVGYEVEGDSRYVEAYNRFGQRKYDYVDREEVFESWLKIFRGVTTVKWHHGQDRTYVSFDTPEWRKKMGIEPDKDLSGEDPLAEIRAWLDGDVWGVQVQKRWNPDNKQTVQWWEGAEDECWGFYGRKYAMERAKEMLAEVVASHKPVHRYPAHERLEKVSDEVTVILDYLKCKSNLDAMPEQLRAGASAVLQEWNERSVYSFYGVDYDELKAERELKLTRQREAERSA